MNKSLARAALLSASLSLLAGSASAGTFNINSASTTAQTLSGGQTGTITSSGTLTVSGSTVAVTLNGSSSTLLTLTNSGTINQTGSGRAIRDNVGNLTVQVTNNAGATIQAKDADVIQMNVPSSAITLDNYGTFTSTNSSNGGAQAIDWAVLTSSNVLHNYSTGLLQANEADAVRLGLNGVLTNDGTIKATNNVGTGSSSDGVDAQTNSGQSITNANTGTGPALIEGARHAITGGDVNGGVYTMTVTNKAGGTIQGDNGSGINIDGANANELVTVTNAGTITGKGVKGATTASVDGDGVDVDGLVNIQNSGTIKSLNAYNDTSEGISVGGGTIVNTSTGIIQGSISDTTGGNTGTGRGIVLTGVDKNAAGNPIPVQPIYANSTIDNSGLIKGDSESGIAVLGGASGFTTTITNQVGGKIEGGGTVAVIQTNANDVHVINKGTIEAKGTGKAVDFGTGTNNTLAVTGGAAAIIGDVAGSTGTGSTFTINPGTGNSFSYAGKISNFSQVEVSSGHVTLSGASTYTGTTKVSGGILTLGAANAIASASPVVLMGGTLDAAGFSPVSSQVLTLQGAVASTLDFGTGHVGSVTITFADSHTASWAASLNLVNFVVGIDELNFGAIGGLTSSQLNAIQLANYTATALDASGNVLFAPAVVPEPGTAGSILLGLVALTGIMVWRRRQAGQV